MPVKSQSKFDSTKKSFEVLSPSAKKRVSTARSKKRR